MSLYSMADNLLKNVVFCLLFLPFSTFASEQIIVKAGENYNITDGDYTEYQDESLNGAVVSVSGTLNVTGPAAFKNNIGNMGGVIYNEGITSVVSSKVNSVFGANSAGYGGAIYNSDTGRINEISLALFQRNHSNSGGVIFNSNSTDSVGGGVINTITKASFIENSAGTGQGGAINNQGMINNIGTIAFISNTASDGGAVFNDTFGRIGTISSSSFNSNYALTGDVKNGGAISNAGIIESISDSSFVGNRAGSLGGAIFNDKTASITFNGKNSFSSNFADGSANDIYNDGTIIIADGTTTISGGISGSGTLDVDSGATLSIGATTLQQGILNLDGTLSASIVNEESFGKIDVGTINVGENGKFDLTLGATGTYDFGTTLSLNNIDYNESIYNLSIEGTNIIVKTKSVDEIVADAGVSYEAALVMVGLANSSDYSMNIASLTAQSELLAGNTEYLENESSKLVNEEAPVTQSMAVSIQNQIFALASSRMNGGSIGRNGGDVNIGYGFWAQGLMNRTKYSDVFLLYASFCLQVYAC